MTNTPIAMRTPLRRSEIGVMRPPRTPMLIAVSIFTQTTLVALDLNIMSSQNNDEEERRARRKTILQTVQTTPSVRIEDSETLKNCMQMFADNVSLLRSFSLLISYQNIFFSENEQR